MRKWCFMQLPDKDLLFQTLPSLNLESCFSVESASAAFQALYKLYGFDVLQAELHCKHYCGQIQLGGTPCVAHCWMPKGANIQTVRSVIIAHGLFDHSGLYLSLIARLLREGFVVFMPDMPGHGLSTGEPAAIDDFHRYGAVVSDSVLTLRHQGAADIALIGQSAGASAVLRYLLDVVGDSGIQRVVLLAPLLRPVATGLIKFTYPLMHLFSWSIRRRFTRNSNDEAFCHFLEYKDPLQPRVLPHCWVTALLNWIRWFETRVSAIKRGDEKHLTQPVLIIQGLKDQTVDWRYNLAEIATVFDNSQLLEIPEARHHLVNESEPVREQVFDALIQFLSNS